MLITKDEFKIEYGKAVSEGYGAVFAGAGLSKSAGFINWKELVAPFATALSLDVEKESDLIGLTQFYKNEKGNRSDINQRILNSFLSDESLNDNIRIITRLPISTYWTTNYDELIEEGLKENNRRADVKISPDTLSINIVDRDAIVYKMHGDVRTPSEAVLTKDDYETYNQKRKLFTTALQGDLVSKTFLFIGFSFEDPNLDYILGRIRVLLGESVRNHYCFLEKVNIENYETDEVEKFNRDSVMQELKIRDLQRYGIQTILLDSYSEITGLLLDIEREYFNKSVFISGSISDYNDIWTEHKVNQFCFSLSKKLTKKNYRIISGFGLGVGSNVINGALDEVYSSKYKKISEHLVLRPFPQIETEEISILDQWERYRQDMIGESGICIFIFGNKKKGLDTVPADGMIKEFRISQDKGKIVIPVGATGEVSLTLMNEIEANIEKYPYLVKHIKDLKNPEIDSNILVDIIVKIVDEVQTFL